MQIDCPAFLQHILLGAQPATVFISTLCDRHFGLVVKASASRAENPWFESRLRRGGFPGRAIPVASKLVLQSLPCQAPVISTVQCIHTHHLSRASHINSPVHTHLSSPQGQSYRQSPASAGNLFLFSLSDQLDLFIESLPQTAQD